MVHWVQDAEEPPAWAEAHRRLQQEGRRSRVSHPTEAQRRFEIREPRTGGGVADMQGWHRASGHRGRLVGLETRLK